MSATAGRVARLEVSTDDITYFDVAPWVDGTLQIEVEALDCTSHQSNGSKEFIPNHDNATMSFQLFRDETENGQTILRDAVFTKAVLYFKVYPTVASGADVYEAQGFSTQFDESFNRDETQNIDGTIQLSSLVKSTQP